jgi:glutamate synthase domain-containing protein 2
MKNIFWGVFITLILLIGVAGYFKQDFWALYLIVVPFFLLGIFDVLQRQHTLLRNFPIIAHFRYMFEAIRPQVYQYFIESETDGRPLEREQREVVYERAKGVLSTRPYGTKENVYEVGYEWINHSLMAKRPTDLSPRMMIGNSLCTAPYSASIFNISAMSYGAISSNATLALNRGALTGKFYQNTGEGGLSDYHLRYGGDLVWQIGTAYFGCRNYLGEFMPDLFAEKARLPSIKMIEIKLSQGAKPGFGGILPAAKLTAEIAAMRCVPMGEDVISPPTHNTFNTPIGLLEFVQKLRELSGGKPIGIKLCLGSHVEFMAICKAMLATQTFPDFITVDGGEGGTGAAPIEFTNSVGTPLTEGLIFIHNALVGAGLRDKIRIICAGKLLSGFSVASKLALGADLCNSARGMMLALGCIHSLKCNTNRCPTGVTTQDPRLVYGLNVEDKYQRVARYHAEVLTSLAELVACAGLDTPSQLRPYHLFRRISATEVRSFDQIYPYMREPSLLDGTADPFYAKPWSMAKESTF